MSGLTMQEYVGQCSRRQQSAKGLQSSEFVSDRRVCGASSSKNSKGFAGRRRVQTRARSLGKGNSSNSSEEQQLVCRVPVHNREGSRTAGLPRSKGLRENRKEYAKSKCQVAMSLQSNNRVSSPTVCCITDLSPLYTLSSLWTDTVGCSRESR
jgi:hypothetical protein